MQDTSISLVPRAARLFVDPGLLISLFHDEQGLLGRVRDISSTGLLFASPVSTTLHPGARLAQLVMDQDGRRLDCGPSVVVRVSPLSRDSGCAVAVKFDSEQPGLLESLKSQLPAPAYATGELAPDALSSLSSRLDGTEFTLDKFHDKPSPDILEKCGNFRPWVDDLQLKQLYQRMWRVTLNGPLDHQIRAYDPMLRVERTMLCFDSNSYLGLHRDPRVIERTVQVVRQDGYGTPSAQMLGGTNRHLRELEQDLSEFLGREDTIVFPTGFAANVGTISALVRKNDAVLRDRFAHASIHEGCRNTRSRFNHVFAHNGMTSLEQQLRLATKAGCDGKLIVTDGVFSMHGAIAPLPELVGLARRHSARLMIDDAHGLGVLGESGRGIEDLYGMPGSVDVLMGTLSKALGAIGGFVSGSRDLVYYLRFFAAAGMFTTALPAATCAGLREALTILRNEPEHRNMLWENVRFFSPELARAGFIVSDPVSPIATVYLGDHRLMLEFSRELFDAGIKCGSIMYPAVPKGDAILRFALNARHTRRELEYAVDVLTRAGRKWGVLQRSREEIREIGAKATPGGRERSNIACN